MRLTSLHFAFRKTATAIVALLVSSTLTLLVPTSLAIAAPMDALLAANPPGKGEISAAYDFMNERFDFLDMEEDFNAPTDYKGGHVRAGMAVTDHLWIDGSLWQRSVAVGSFDATLDTWQLAGQYRILDGGDNGMSLALRASLWGDATDEVKRSYNLFSGATRTSLMVIDNPHDEQAQIDLIASLPVTTRFSVNAFTSIGKSDVGFDDVKATATYQGCSYDLVLGHSGYVGTLASPCDEDIVVTRYAEPYDADDINIHKEMRYSAYYYQIGLTSQWLSDNWRLRAGYLYLAIDRKDVDDALEVRDKETFKTNQSLLLDIGYRVWRNLSLNLAAQYFNNQFTGEIPFTYNSATAKHFGHPYGLLSGGIVVAF